MTDSFETLDGLHDAAWRRMEDAARDRRGPAHLVTLATAGQDGPDARLLVLRRADRIAGEVEVWTNGKSAKIGALEEDPRATVLIWDPDAQLQVRLGVHVDILPGPADVWETLPIHAKRNYGVGPAPSDPLSTPEEALSATPSRDAFVKLVCRVHRMECLHFDQDLHRRAVFTADHRGWITP